MLSGGAEGEPVCWVSLAPCGGGDAEELGDVLCGLGKCGDDFVGVDVWCGSGARWR